MEIGVRYSGGVTVIVPQGSITTSGVEGLRAALAGEPKGHGIVIDARGLEYLCPAAEVLVLALSLPDLFAPESVAAAGGSMEVLKIVAYRDSHHIPTWVSVAKRLSSSDYFYPDGSPFCHSSRSSSNGNRSACLRHKQACSNKTPPLVFAHGFGHKKRAPIHPQCGTNRHSMYITIFDFICYNCMVFKTSAFFD